MGEIAGDPVVGNTDYVQGAYATLPIEDYKLCQARACVAALPGTQPGPVDTGEGLRTFGAQMAGEPGGSGGCGCGAGGANEEGIERAAEVLSEARAKAVQGSGLPMGGSSCGIVGPCSWDPWTGSFRRHVFLPTSGGLSPTVMLTYNSRGPATEFGNGWTAVVRRRVVSLGDSDAEVTDGTGATFYYTNLSGGVYTPPNGWRNSLEKIAGGWKETQPNGLEFRYIEATDTTTQAVTGLLDEIRYGGATWTVRYEGSGNFVKYVQDPCSKRTTFVYDSGSPQRIRRVVDVAGRITTFARNTAGDLTTITTPELCGYSISSSSWSSPGGISTTFRFDSQGRMTMMQPGSAGRVTVTYYPENGGRYPRAVLDPLNCRTTLIMGWDGQSRILPTLRSMVDAHGGRTTYTWSGHKLVEQRSPLGHRTTFTHLTTSKGATVLGSVERACGKYSFRLGANDRVDAAINELGARTSLVYDGSGRRSAEINALARRTTFGYSTSGQVKSVKNGLGYVVTFAYGSNCRLARVVNAKSEITSFGYNSYQQRVRVRNPLSNITTSVLDLMNRTVAQVSPLLQRTTYTFNSDCQLVEMKNPLGNAWQYRYWGPGLLRSRIDPLSNRVTWTYDVRTNRVRVTDPLSRHTTTVYDCLNRTVASVSPANVRTTTIFDADGRAVATVRPGGARWTTAFDACGRPVGDLMLLGFRTTSVFDKTGRPIASINALNQRSTTVYNAMRWSVASVNGLGQRTTTVYDTIGRGVASINGLGLRNTSVFDAANRRVASVNPLGQRSTSVYDAAGRRVAAIDGLGRRSTSVFDAANRGVSSVNPLGQRSTTVFDAANQRVASVNGLGYRNTSVFDAAGRRLASVDPLGNRTTTIFNAASQGVASVNPLGKRWTTVYDGAGRQSASVDPLLNRSTTVYDSLGRAAASINPLGRRTTTIFDGAWRQVSSVTPLGIRSTTIFDAAGRGVATSNPLGYRTTNVFDAAGRSVASIDPLSNRSTVVYNAAGQAVRNVNPLGKISTTVFDAAGRSIASVTPLGFRSTQVYNAAGQGVRSVNPLGRIWTTVYDLAGRGVANLNPLGQRSTTVFDGAGRAVASVNPLAKRWTTVFDAARRSVASINPLGYRSTVVYNAGGQAIRSVNPLGKISTSVFDAAGRTVASVNPLGYRNTYLYNNASEQVSVRDANNNRTTQVFDGDGRNVAQLNALGIRVTYVLDAASQRVALVDGRANRNTFVFDAAGRERAWIDPLLRRNTSAYDAAGQKTLRHDARGYRTSYVFDDDGRLTQRRYPDGSRVTFAYDAAGGRTKMQDSLGRYTTVFDELGREKRVSDCFSKTITYGYDAAGNRRSMIDPDGGRFTYTWDGANRLDWLVNPWAERTSWTYDAAGRTQVQKLANGTRASYTYDDADRLSTLYNLKSDGTVISSFAYAYDQTINKTRVIEADGVRVTWSYDKTYQLTREQRSGANACDTTYTYDAAQNRRLKIDSGARTTYTCDAANQLSWVQDSTGRTTYTFDASGNQERVLTPTGQRTTYVWEFENRNTVVSQPSGARTTMAYEAYGRRMLREDASGTVRFLWDESVCLGEIDTSIPASTRWTTRPLSGTGLLSQRRGTASHYFHFDGTLSTRAVSEASGSVGDTYLWTAFGVPVFQTGATVNPFRFVGQRQYYTDPSTASAYVLFRTYSPIIARWQSVDPLLGLVGNSLYSYADNNPSSKSDIAGLYVTATHVSLTEEAVKAWMPLTLNQPSAQCRAYLTRMLVCCNLAVDFGPSFKDFEKHYNRPFRVTRGGWPLENYAEWGVQAVVQARLNEGQLWDSKYGAHIDSLEQEFYSLVVYGDPPLTFPPQPPERFSVPAAESCAQRLRILGALLHSWQDFFAHAVRRDQLGNTHPVERTRTRDPGFRVRFTGSSDADWPGFSAFEVGTTGTPRSRGSFMPSSFGGLMDSTNAEHPSAREPIKVGTNEYDMRLAAAKSFVQGQLSVMLGSWWNDCMCYCPCVSVPAIAVCDDCQLALFTDLGIRAVKTVLQQFVERGIPTYCRKGSRTVVPTFLTEPDKEFPEGIPN
jgi:RHS repeat-associated protein